MPIELTAENFETEVVESEVPVLIDLYTPTCGPCRALAPILERLAEEYDGKVKVGKINVQAERELGQAFNVQSVPMIVSMKGRDVQEVTVGFRGEAQIRDMFDNLVA